MQEVRFAMNCHQVKSYLPDLLFDAEAVPVAVREHASQCTSCAGELADLKATMNILDEWSAPEPSPYFATRMQARLRNEMQQAPEGFWERMRARLLFSSNFQLRTAGAAALAAVIAIGGGSALYEVQHAAPAVQTQASATVRDLQSLDGNAQVFQQLNALDADTDGDSASN